MRKINLLCGLSLVFVFFLSAQKVYAEDVDLTNKIVNNDFELAVDANCNVVPITADMDGYLNNAWRPSLSTCADLNHQIYGWKWVMGNGVEGFGTTGAFTVGSNSQGMNKDADPISTMHGDWICWIGSSTFTLPDGIAEFYQTINGLSAGTYKVQCRLAVGERRTSQRLFAKTGDDNIVVQYHGTETQYASNKTEGEVATFAGWPSGEKNLQEMVVTINIAADNDPLTIGIRTGNIKGDGNKAAAAGAFWGWFKTDYFRLTKLDSSNLKEVKGQTATWSVNNGELTVKGIESYAVYNVNGLKIAEAKCCESVNLVSGVYVVKTNNAETFKVVVK